MGGGRSGIVEFVRWNLGLILGLVGWGGVDVRGVSCLWYWLRFVLDVFDVYV